MTRHGADWSTRIARPALFSAASCMKVPFHLAQHGYRADPTNPMRFIHPNGHPFHPVIFEDDRQKNDGECARAIAVAAFEAGVNLETDLVRRALELLESRTRHVEAPSPTAPAPTEWRGAEL